MRVRRPLLSVVLAAMLPVAASPTDFQVSAQVDRTTLDVGGQLTLTVTLEGNMKGAEIKPIQLPPGFIVVAQSRASNVSVRPDGVKRALSLIYVLMPKESGTFELGPFTVVRKSGRRGQESVSTEPIQVVVKRPVVPPSLQRHERFLL